MNKVIYIILIIAVGITAYFLLKSEDTSKILKHPPRIKTQTGPGQPGTVIDRKPRAPEIPEVYDFTKLKVDSRFRPASIELPDSISVNNKVISISVNIPEKVDICDLFLLNNKTKRDMYYQVPGGRYNFKNVILSEGKNEVDIFYRIGRKRSPSATCVVYSE